MSRFKSKPPFGSRGLSREAIVEAALNLVEEVGASGFTLRKLGARMGCDPMSILYHFKSKEGIHQAMADRMEVQIRPAEVDHSWRSRMRHLADQYRSTALRFSNSFWLMRRFLHTGHADRLCPLSKRAMPLYQGLAPSAVFSLSVEVFLDGIRGRAAGRSAPS